MANNLVTCEKCGSVVGTLVIIRNVEWLQMGGGICREWHGVCAQCGEGFHWSVSDKLLEKIVQARLTRAAAPA